MTATPATAKVIENVTEPSLDATQRWLLKVVSTAGRPAEGLTHAQAQTGLGSADETLLQKPITAGPRLSAVDRVAIYHHAYWARLVEYLADDYPALAYALGAEAFRALALVYIDKHPSRTSSLNGYGALLPAFLRGYEKVPAYAANLADLEWALVDVVHAPAEKPLAGAVLASLPPEAWSELRFHPAPGLRVLSLSWNVNGFYQAFRQQGEAAPPEPGVFPVAVYRHEATLWRMDIPLSGRSVLQALLAGRPLGEAFGAANDQVGSDSTITANDVQQWFQTWMQAGFFIGFTRENEA